MEQRNNIFIASDHAGYDLKAFLISKLTPNFNMRNLGTHSSTISVDYNDYAEVLINKIQREFGILICKTGIGMSIAANRYTHIRAALCINVESAKLARQHNDANILVLSAMSDFDTAAQISEIFLMTKFSHEERHIRRVKKLSDVK